MTTNAEIIAMADATEQALKHALRQVQDARSFARTGRLSLRSPDELREMLHADLVGLRRQLSVVIKAAAH